jgi:hypothetical protein
MPVLRDIDIADMVTTTLEDLGRGRFHQIAQELQEYLVLPRIMRKEKIRIQSSGIGVKETLMTSTGGTARWVGLLEEDALNINDLLTTMTVRWCRLTDNMAWERRMLLENRGQARINNVIKPQRAAMMIRMAAALEAGFFAAPDASDVKIPWGLKYYVVKNATTGFNGGLPSGFSTVAGVNITTYPTFKNYTFQYTDVTKVDLIKKLRTAHRKTRWRSPVKKPGMISEFGERRQIFVNETTISEIEDVGEAQNENLGRDVASMDDQIVFKKHPIIWVPYLDTDTSYPIYMIDTDTIIPFILKGDYLRESDVIRSPRQHNTFESHIDLSINFIMTNRRANAVGYI